MTTLVQPIQRLWWLILRQKSSSLFKLLAGRWYTHIRPEPKQKLQIWNYVLGKLNSKTNSIYLQRQSKVALTFMEIRTYITTFNKSITHNNLSHFLDLYTYRSLKMSWGKIYLQLRGSPQNKVTCVSSAQTIWGFSAHSIATLIMDLTPKQNNAMIQTFSLLIHHISMAKNIQCTRVSLWIHNNVLLMIKYLCEFFYFPFFFFFCLFVYRASYFGVRCWFITEHQTPPNPRTLPIL